MSSDRGKSDRVCHLVLTLCWHCQSLKIENNREFVCSEIPCCWTLQNLSSFDHNVPCHFPTSCSTVTTCKVFRAAKLPMQCGLHMSDKVQTMMVIFLMPLYKLVKTYSMMHTCHFNPKHSHSHLKADIEGRQYVQQGYKWQDSWFPPGALPWQGSQQQWIQGWGAVIPSANVLWQDDLAWSWSLQVVSGTAKHTYYHLRNLRSRSHFLAAVSHSVLYWMHS
jgi:hypothetical protein